MRKKSLSSISLTVSRHICVDFTIRLLHRNELIARDDAYGFITGTTALCGAIATARAAGV
jgi:hypothetical protein